MRINDDDIKEIKELTDKLESKDSMEYKGILTVENSSSSNVLYEDRERLKTFNNPMEKLDPVPNLPTRLK